MGPQRALLPTGRWHFQHGPVDLVIDADGDPEAVAHAHAGAWERFATVLPELVAELGALRQAVASQCPLRGAVARRMWWACHPHRRHYITPMAAVAGAVAQELLHSYRRDGVRRAWVNNGGDIALHLAPGSSVRIGVVSDLRRVDLDLQRAECELEFELNAHDPVRGVATSGWRGRSLSLGIADSVTVLAAEAAQADAAATVIANAVNVQDARIRRLPACDVRDDSDLGSMPVTVDVPELPPEQVRRALHAGASCARALQRRGLIHAAVLVCQRQTVQVAPNPAAGLRRRDHPEALSLVRYLHDHVAPPPRSGVPARDGTRSIP
jgi:ApbE superfamily uncharacterized protein (UPF0280 family)